MALVPKFRPDMVTLVTTFIRDTFAQASRTTAVVGLSGGVDSSLVAKLCVDALGPKHTLGVGLPEKDSPPEDLTDAKSLAKELGISFQIVDITPMVESFRQALKVKDRKALGNIKARARMIVLYDVAARNDGLVLGTGNKSEVCTQYFTKWGDGAVDLLPIGDLYKTQVWQMARHLGLPKTIVEKRPSAGLWKGQTDEGELGISYPDLDSILLGLEMELPPEEIASRTGLDLGKVERIEAMVRAGAHKRKMPPIPKVGIRTFGLDWKE